MQQEAGPVSCLRARAVRTTVGLLEMRSSPSPSPAALRRWDPVAWSDWLVPLVAAALWALLVAQGAASGVELARSLVFVGGPLVLLAGLHGRLAGYLHADARRWLLPLPIEPRIHFGAAAMRRRRGLWATALGGSAALGLALVSEPAASRLDGFQRIGLLVDFAWLALLAGLVEPAVAGIAAWLGRRFPVDSAAHRLQRSLGGGWTIPEAVVHLYAPAMGIGTTAALAMPGQLLVDRFVDGLPVGRGLIVATAIGAALALVFRAVARPLYARGLFGAVPWLAEATRTLAGPPTPELAPGWILRLRDPGLRLWLLQLWRTTSLPTLRLLALLGWGTVLAMSSAPPDVTRWAVAIALVALWLVPAFSLVQLRTQRKRLLAPLPLDAHRLERRAWALVCTPAFAVIAVAGLRAGGAW
jgi:hypothetical protein